VRLLAAPVAAACVLLAGCAADSSTSGSAADRVVATPGPMPVPSTPGPWDWPTYGHDAQHSFAGHTTLTAASAATLRQAWYFPTGDAVSATPTVVDGTVYVGSWDDNFYAVDLATGTLRWKVRLKSQNGITPYPGDNSRRADSDGGLVTSSAWFEPADAAHPALVLFGGGYTLYALVAATGAVFWEHDYSGAPPGQVLDPATDGTRIFSSPVVVDGRVLFGVDVDGDRGYGGSIVAADIDTGAPLWRFQTDTSPQGAFMANGCGSVWTSGTLLPAAGLVVFGTADCHFDDTQPLSESVLALHVDTGTLAWSYTPDRGEKCDLDFGASANAGLAGDGSTTFLGEGSKGGTYYSFDPGTGHLRWSTNVVFGGFAGGFIGTTAYDGTRVYGATALGDFGNFDANGKAKLCDPANPSDQPTQNPTTHAFDAQSGAVLWQKNSAGSFAPTTVAGGLTFNGLVLAAKALDVRVAATGRLVARVPLPQLNWSGIATVGDALVLGLGSTYDPRHSGIIVLTPGGAPPVVPASH
jgi:outer membrane protein assembly factor BamB